MSNVKVVDAEYEGGEDKAAEASRVSMASPNSIRLTTPHPTSNVRQANEGLHLHSTLTTPSSNFSYE